jgi:hypothetical protein
MAGNAHRNRAKLRTAACPSLCKFCAKRPNVGDFKNSNGNRHNGHSKKRGRRNRSR